LVGRGELHRIYTTTFVTNDRSLVDLLRGALLDHERASPNVVRWITDRFADKTGISYVGGVAR
jgi:hypothetical protein